MKNVAFSFLLIISIAFTSIFTSSEHDNFRKIYHEHVDDCLELDIAGSAECASAVPSITISRSSPDLEEKTPRAHRVSWNDLETKTPLPSQLHSRTKLFPLPSPRSSPLNMQLSKMDRLLASKFPLRTGNSPQLMQSFLDLLQRKCTETAKSLGPLNRLYRNCSARFHELRHFFELLTKYETDPLLLGSSVISTTSRNHLSFCEGLKTALKQLKAQVISTINEAHSLAEFFPTSPEKQTALEEEFSKFHAEFRQLEKEIDSVDFNLNILCSGGIGEVNSYAAIKEYVNALMFLAFIN